MTQATTQARVLPGPAGQPIRPHKLAHVVLRVSDLPRSRAWYLQVLQGWPAFENEMLCFLTYDDEHHRIGLLAQPGFGQPGDAQSLAHIAFTYATLGELLATYRRLAAAGVAPYWAINHGPTISFYYKDPDGNRLELQYDVFAKAEDLDAFFASGAYEENFMGILVDPAAMAARYEAGEPLAELTARPRLAPGQSPWDMHVQ